MNTPGRSWIMVKNRILLLFILCFSIVGSVHAQVAQNRYLVFFADKANTPYSIADPSQYLSQRALDRRNAQNIAIDAHDLPVDPAYVQALQNLGDVEILYRLKWSNAILIETTDPNVLQNLSGLDGFDRLEVSRVLRTAVEPAGKTLTPSKSDSDYGPSLNQIDMLNGLGLHNEGFRGAGKWIAVLDGGFSHGNTAAVLDTLHVNQRVIETYNFVDGNTDVYQRSGHGTQVLSTMAGYQVDSLIGTAPEANYILEITEDVQQERRIEEAFWEAGAEYADSIGADIITSSLGYTTFDVIDDNYPPSALDGNTALITKAADMAASRGILTITSAGNSGNEPWHLIGFPADGDSVLAIGAVNPDGVVTGFSSRGPSADGRVKPNVMAQGGFSVISDLTTGIQTGAGTSFSAPILAGMAACLWQAYPDATAWEVFQAIEKSASLFEMPNDSMGYGIPDFEIARDLLQQVLDVDNPTGFDKMQALRLSPNPYSGGVIHVSVSLPAGVPFEASVYSLSGKTILVRDKFADLSSFEKQLASVLEKSSSGVYLVHLRSADNRLFVGKVVVR